VDDRTYDRTREDLGNIVALEHVNLSHDNQQHAILFYVVGLGLTRDPYVVVGLDNMWVNVGRNQFHLPTRGKQLLRGRVGVVVPDLDAAMKRLERVAKPLAGTAFSFTRGAGFIDTTCPWGNRIRLHAPGEEFGTRTLGIPYVQFDVPPGAAPGIARFYERMIGVPASVETREGAPATAVIVGKSQRLFYRETDAEIPPYDGHHIQVYVADFSGPHAKLRERGLVFEESDAYQYRFKDLVDPDTGKVLFTIEHEVRSVTHPLYGRDLVNRNPDQTNLAYVRNADRFAGTY
jgi:hypothetical protein